MPRKTGESVKSAKLNFQQGQKRAEKSKRTGTSYYRSRCQEVMKNRVENKSSTWLERDGKVLDVSKLVNKTCCGLSQVSLSILLSASLFGKQLILIPEYWMNG